MWRNIEIREGKREIWKLWELSVKERKREKEELICACAFFDFLFVCVCA